MTVAASPVVPASSVPLIELDRACVIRGQVRVLHDLSLRIEQGQHTALLGPNGCGKSSFIKLITRELYPLAHGDGTVAVRVLGCGGTGSGSAAERTAATTASPSRSRTPPC